MVKKVTIPLSSLILITLLIIISFFAGYFFFKSKSLEKGSTVVSDQNQQPEIPKNVKIKKPETKEHWRGSAQARYAWIEYTDLECPFCKQIHPDLTKLLNNYNGQLAWVFRHFPLPFHPKAQKSAEATECAADAGGNDAFWKMVDRIFATMPEMTLEQLPTLASELGLDQAVFQQCLDSGKYEQKVKDQMEEGTTAGVEGTPHN